MHQVVVAQEAAARQGTHATKTRGDGPRRRQEALPAEGHRAGQAGLAAGAAVRRWRRRARAGAALVRPAHAQEDEGRRAARRAVRPDCSHGRLAVVSAFVEGERAEHQGSHDGAARRDRRGRARLRRPVLVVVSAGDELVTEKSLRNLERVRVLDSGQLNTYDVLVCDHVVFTQAALASSWAGTGGGAHGRRDRGKARQPSPLPRPKKASRPRRATSPRPRRTRAAKADEPAAEDGDEPAAKPARASRAKKRRRCRSG